MKNICYIASGAGLLAVLIAAALPHTDYTAAAAMIGAVTIYGGFVVAENINYDAERRRQSAALKRARAVRENRKVTRRGLGNDMD